MKKATYTVDIGLLFYITFEAEDPEDGNCVETFEAPVLNGIPERKGELEIEVRYCRRKSTKGKNIVV